eukprot:jgi/Phyca11/103457/e_gw1.8.322.1
MDFLDSIRGAVLRQKEEEAANLFSSVRDFREFITRTRPAVDICVPLRMCCLHVERLKGTNATRVVLVDGRRCVEVNTALNAVDGSMYVLHQVEYVGLYDGIAKGSIQYEYGNLDKIREIAPPLKKRTYW